MNPLLKRLGLPTEYGGNIELAAELAAHDKKSVGGAVEAVFVNEIGSFEIKALPFGELLALARAAYK